MSALTDLFTAFANKIRSKTGGSDTYTPPQMVNAIDDVYQAGVNAGTTPTQTKTVTAGTSATTVTPDTGYALSSVTVNPTPSQSKSATPTTSSQTITPDSGKLLSSVSVGAIQTETKSDTPNVSTNKTVSPSSGKYLSQVTIQPLTHSGTYTPAANTAQNDMGAYHDKRYVNTSGMIVPSGNKAITSNGTGIDVSSYATASVSVSGTSITPSNSSPASMSSGSLYTPSASGYAISSYSSVTPSNSSPVSLSSGSIYKMGGAGKAVASVTSVAPSNSSPATLTSGTVYKPSANGVAISSYSSITPSSSSQSVSSGSIYKMGGNGVVVDALPTINSITPSNSNPVSMTANNNYKPSANGYAIEGYQSVSPSESGTYFSSGMKNMGTSGYAYSSQQPKFKSGTIVFTAASQKLTVDLGFRPKYLGMLFQGKTGSTTSYSSGATRYVMNYDYNPNYVYGAYRNQNGTNSMAQSDLSADISDTGFSFMIGNNSVYVGTYYYFAVG